MDIGKEILMPQGVNFFLPRYFYPLWTFHQIFGGHKFISNQYFYKKREEGKDKYLVGKKIHL